MTDFERKLLVTILDKLCEYTKQSEYLIGTAPPELTPEFERFTGTGKEMRKLIASFIELQTQ